MSSAPGTPVIFISYSHKDEPDQPQPGEVRWLSEILSYLSPAVRHGCPATYELWDDRQIGGGSNWRAEIEGKLAACTICILLLSRHSLDSDFVLKVEVETIQERRRRGENVQLFPIVLSRFPESSVPTFLLRLQLRPGLTRPLSGMSGHTREEAISKIVDEIITLLRASPAAAPQRKPAHQQPAYVHITGLPETPYVNLVGRDAELARLDAAWTDPTINIISLVAEGGAGKSALVNEWLKRLRVENYRGAEMVLGWSFYSQGTKERATSADGFLDWALNRLGLAVAATSAAAKAEAIAAALIKRRALLVLDGVEPLQHGPGPQLGQLKDQGLRALLRHIAAAPPASAHGLLVLSSRLAVADLARWQDSAAPVVDLEHLSDAAGAALLRDSHVWGTDRDLQATSRDFGGHPLALQLLAGLLEETRNGDVRRRDEIRVFLADPDNPRHDHARRVLKSYETEWLAGQPELLAIMQLVGLFDRPASADCLKALRAKPAIAGLTDRPVAMDDAAWQRAVARLRAVRLLLPIDRQTRRGSMPIRSCANGLASGCGRRMRPPGGKRMPGYTSICATRREKGRRRRLPTSPRSTRRSPMAAVPAGTNRRWTKCGRRASSGATNIMRAGSWVLSEAIWRRFRGSSTNRLRFRPRHCARMTEGSFLMRRHFFFYFMGDWRKRCRPGAPVCG
jgi:TIR domain/AAA ATPase domain